MKKMLLFLIVLTLNVYTAEAGNIPRYDDVFKNDDPYSTEIKPRRYDNSQWEEEQRLRRLENRQRRLEEEDRNHTNEDLLQRPNSFWGQ